MPGSSSKNDTQRRSHDVALPPCRMADTIIGLMSDGIAVISADGQVEFMNPAATRILGLCAPDSPNGVDAVAMKAGSPATELGLLLKFYDTDDHQVDLEVDIFASVRRTGNPIIGQVLGIDRPDGQRAWVSGNVSVLTPDDPGRSDLLISFSDITARQLTTQQLIHEATHDYLTGLPNRMFAVDRIDTALQCGNAVSLAAILFVDLDDFKIINDSLGHEAGDTVLRLVAQRLRGAVRDEDVVARFGGDEFVILLFAPATRADIDSVVARLQDALSTPLVSDAMSLNISASIGIIEVLPDDQRATHELLRDADLAMYAVKADGKVKSIVGA